MTKGVPSTAKRIETRFLVKNDSGVYGVTYRWDSPTNATLVPTDGQSDTFVINDGGQTRTQVWNYPARNQCVMCHNQTVGWVDGFNTVQLNRAHNYGAATDNQIKALSDAGYFTATAPDPTTLPKLAAATDESATL